MDNFMLHLLGAVLIICALSLTGMFCYGIYNSIQNEKICLQHKEQLLRELYQ